MKTLLNAAWERRINTGLPVSHFKELIETAEKQTGLRGKKATELKGIIRFLNKSINQN